MKLKFLEIFVADGQPDELAIYTHMLLQILRAEQEANEKKEKEMDSFSRLLEKPFAELMRSEMDIVNDPGEQKPPADHGHENNQEKQEGTE